MNESLPQGSRVSDGRVWPDAPSAAGFNLLLVSRSEAWKQAVRGAARDGGVHGCSAREALARLAGFSPPYSHLLVEPADADGLFDELADLAAETGPPGTDMLVLGGVEGRRANTRTILEASVGSVREALMTAGLPRDGPAMDLAQLRGALGGTMIANRYQPIVRMADRRPLGLEALVRLDHPDLGTLLPDRFVPQIEDAGLAAELTGLVSRRAFADLADARLAQRGVRMSLNFPLDVLLQSAALVRLEEQRAAFGIQADRIILELTESRSVDDFPSLRRSLDHVRSLGYGVAIDDAGPAVPRLAELLDLPFTSLKLDKDLVKQANDLDAIRAFLAATITQGKNRGLTVVAEGVETAAIWNRMRALGVDEAQGFLVARPLPLAAVPIWSDAWAGVASG